jgi:hypothetical protein
MRRSPWPFVLSFGVISLLSDVVYRHPGRHRAAATPGPATRPWWSVATARVVSVVTGAGDAGGRVLRLGSGVWADRTRRFWGFAAASIAAGTVLPRRPSAPPAMPVLFAFLTAAGLLGQSATAAWTWHGPASWSPRS